MEMIYSLYFGMYKIFTTHAPTPRKLTYRGGTGPRKNQWFSVFSLRRGDLIRRSCRSVGLSLTFVIFQNESLELWVRETPFWGVRTCFYKMINTLSHFTIRRTIKYMCVSQSPDLFNSLKVGWMASHSSTAEWAKSSSLAKCICGQGIEPWTFHLKLSSICGGPLKCLALGSHPPSQC